MVYVRGYLYAPTFPAMDAERRFTQHHRPSSQPERALVPLSDLLVWARFRRLMRSAPALAHQPGAT